MAFGTKYKLEITDTLGIDWSVEIQEDGYASTVTTLIGTNNPIKFDFYGEDDIFEQPILGSKCIIEVFADTSFVFSELFTSDNLEFKVIVKWGTTVFWTGWIQANTYEEPYDCPPYPVRITATDGLGLLKDFQFSELSYTARETQAQIIYDILSLAGISTFTEFVNLFESTMNMTVDDSPFDQCGIDTSLFEEETCYFALTEILKTYNAAIRQDQGVFIIYRIVELKDASMKGRIYTASDTYTSTTRTPEQYIDRDTSASNFHDYNGGSMLMVPQVKKLYITQDLGLKESILLNFDFDYEKFDGSDFENWTQYSGSTINNLAVLMPDAAEKGIVIYGEDTDLTNLQYGIYQDVVDVAESVTDRINIIFEYAGFADSSVSTQIYIAITVDDGADMYYFDGAAWQLWGIGDPIELLIYNSTFSGGWSEWITQSYSITGLPTTGMLRAIIYAPQAADVSTLAIGVRKFQITITDSSNVNIKNVGYVISNAVHGQIIEKENILGDGVSIDNDYIQYKGVLNVYDTGVIVSTSRAWETVTAGSSNGESDPIVELTGGELGDQYSRPKQIIDLPIRERHDDEFIKLVGNFQDILNQNGGNNRIFAPSHGSFNVKPREWNLTLTELI